MTTRVFLVRHGATTLSAEDRFAGATNVDLSDEGRAQAGALGRRLATQKIVRVYASPMARTVETAQLLATPHGLAPSTHDGLREIDHGRWEGLTRKEVEARFPDEYAAWDQDPYTYAPEGGEAGVRVMARALPALREMVQASAGHAIVVVSHKATIRLMLCALLGIDARGYRDRLDQDPACLNVLDFKDAVRVRLALFNDTSHYAATPGSPGPRLSRWWDVPLP
jgi:probable phosphoglycerate mutase